MIEALLDSTLDLYLDAVPWLLAGLIAAGLIKGLVSETAMARWLGGEGFGPILRGALVGAPLPLCSCGVLPAALGVRRAGAGRGPTVSLGSAVALALLAPRPLRRVLANGGSVRARLR